MHPRWIKGTANYQKREMFTLKKTKYKKLPQLWNSQLPSKNCGKANVSQLLSRPVEDYGTVTSNAVDFPPFPTATPAIPHAVAM